MRKNLNGVLLMGAMVMALLGCGSAFAAAEAPTTAMMATEVDMSTIYGTYDANGCILEYMVATSTGSDMISITDDYDTSYYYCFNADGNVLYFIDDYGMVLYLEYYGDRIVIKGERIQIHNGTYYKVSSEQEWIYGSYYQDLGEGGISAEIGFYSGTGEDYITLEGSYFDSYGYFSGTIVYTGYSSMYAIDENGNTIYFEYNGSSKITVTSGDNTGGMNFPGFTGTYQKTADLPKDVG